MKDYRDYADTGAVLVDGHIQPQSPHPFAGTHLDPRRKGFQMRTFALACRDLFPPEGRKPAGMGVPEVYHRVCGWYRARKLPIPRSFEREVRRFVYGC
jgi:hypothetical protein